MIIVLVLFIYAAMPVIGSQPVLPLPGEESAPAYFNGASRGVAGGTTPTTAVEQLPEVAAVDAPLTGTATWCAPTPKYCQSWGRPAMVGAVRSFSYGDTPYDVVVSHGDRSVVVTVVSYCACPNTLIDLSVAAFEQLAPLSRGRIPVTVSTLGPSVTVPPTDVTP